MAEEIILVESRKAFFLEYMMVLIVVILALVMKIKGFAGNQLVMPFAAFVIITGLLVPEIVRFQRKTTISRKNMIVSTGILRKTQTKLFTHTITDIDIDQNLWQRIWGYGALIVRSVSTSGDIFLGNIDNPKKAASSITKMIDMDDVSANPKLKGQQGSKQ